MCQSLISHLVLYYIQVPVFMPFYIWNAQFDFVVLLYRVLDKTREYIITFHFTIVMCIASIMKYIAAKQDVILILF